MMTLKERINEDVRNAMRAREARRVGTLRMLLAAIKQREVDERIELDDTAVIAVINRMLKQRKDSIAQFAAAGRQELVDAESFELELLAGYLPSELSASEISDAVTAAIAETGARGPADMAKVMSVLRAKLAGRAEMSEVARLVRARLAGA